MKRFSPQVRFNTLYPFRLPNRRKLKKNIIDLFKKEGRNLFALDYIFCSDEYLLRINQQFLKHNSLTDIITFDLSESGGVVQAEIYISIERVLENAALFIVPFDEELQRVMFHGALHLCGFKDKSAIEKKTMKKKEDFYLKLNR